MPKADEIKEMFDSVAGRYDLLNRVLSLGRDISWRKALAQSLDPAVNSRGLDICCGTGDVALALLKDTSPHRQVELVAADFSPAMCRKARAKIAARYRGISPWSTACTDALRLPFRDAAFDFAAVAFGVRNFEDLQAGLAELYRVIRPGGRLGLLEFAPPRGFILKAFYRPYLAAAPPLLGLLSGSSPGAYRYLSTSIESFLDPGQLSSALAAAGFQDLRARSLTLGVAFLYTALRR